MIFETYIFEYFIVRIFESHWLGLFICVFGVIIADLWQRRRLLYTNIFLSIAQSRNMEYWKQTRNCNIAKQERKKIKTKIFFLNLVHVGCYW